MNFKEIAVQAESSIEAINEVERLLFQTYGAGCVDIQSHPDGVEISRAVRVLCLQLTLLKSRAVILGLMAEASKETKMNYVGLVR